MGALYDKIVNPAIQEQTMCLDARFKGRVKGNREDVFAVMLNI
jgi:hypothetical protein